MGKLKEGAGCALAGVGYIGLSILGLVVHVWTIIIAFSVKGLIGAVITLAMPVLAEVFWFIKVWRVTETILNPYCLSIIAYCVCWVLVVVGVGVSGASET